ncbi:hypothetical protein [Streptosporangium amethystogenes]|nr:hypothetical protein [Streptosporangium amethystogenes]
MPELGGDPLLTGAGVAALAGYIEAGPRKHGFTVDLPQSPVTTADRPA